MRGRRRTEPAATTALARASFLVVALVLGACTGPGGDDESRSGEPSGLRWRPADDVVVCDGTERKAGTVEQAGPGERIEFTTALPIEVGSGRADDGGEFPLTWTCQPEEAQLRWDLTATGAETGRTIELTIVGAPPRTMSEVEPTVELDHDGVVCDGSRREVGVITGLAARDRVIFGSEQDGQPRPKRADESGNLVVTWACRPGDVGRTWEAEAVVDGSGTSVSFELQGLAAPETGPIEVRDLLAEVPCDGLVHPLATLANFFPFEEVTFTATPAADDLRPGTARGDGAIEIRWQCGRDAVGRNWELTAVGRETGKTVAVRFAGVAGAPPVPATVRLVEDPFVCDGERRVVAVLEDLEPGEFVDFTSPQAEALREGRFQGPSLPVNWQCDRDDLGGADTTTWEVTATGRQSGRAATFVITGTITGSAP